MADSIGLPSSQDDVFDSGPFSSQTFASSPPPSSPARSRTSNKIRKPPPITPKRFNKFFTPRTTRNSTGHTASGRQLRDITQNAVNRKKATPRRTVIFSDTTVVDSENFVTPKLGSNKKRKVLPSPESSPVQPSPSKKVRPYAPTVNFDIAEDDEVASDAETTILEREDEDDDDNEDEEEVYHEPIRRAPISSSSGRLLTRTFGGRSALGRGKLYDRCGDWKDQTANFYTHPDDTHPFEEAIPFCTASCNTNSLVAIGDEDGTVTLLESAKNSNPPFHTAHVKFRPHSNAVMDLSFSSDDLMLATASGDQTGHIFDVRTQQSTYVMGGSAGHQSSVKQVRFQPGNDNVIATSSRDGTVRLWDLRCSGSEGAIRNLVGFDGQPTVRESKCTYLQVYNTISGAHTERHGTSAASQANALQRDGPSKGEAPSRRGDVSITALSFLATPGREHLLLTASEASTAVKLWDIRARFNRRAVPIATTRQPESHSKHRQFGINSLSLNGDGSRLYALSRDNTIYAYSTSHLVLGHAPELSATASTKRKQAGMDKEGLGPLYGFRHPRLHATTFWVKTSLRKAKGDKEEMLAVGSSDSSPILFPTDETMLKRTVNPPSRPSTSDSMLSGNRSGLRRSFNSFHARMNDTIPIYNRGTPLVRGHQKEVTSLTWTTDGELVTIGDDCTARCWREDRDAARDLRMGGEAEGRRWGCGWADVGDDYDDDG
ncbi:WD40-repeat-containing domain protein [Macrophomina phaseolina]|uniref:WD40-repeat-containing domain protein n=1 Tax=Macrophomina phaseolina TaxID=35725 RepID=A0ABQ8GS61_9PEZI|nr:WD40-repeat-containing domain protein [Macrophomina phaseolina]